MQLSMFNADGYSKVMMLSAGITTLIIMVIGVLGNLLTLVALLRNSKIRTIAAAFIASLCLSDMLLCLLVLPFSASHFFHGTWIHGEILCKMIPILRYGSVGISLLSIAMISINRYILIAWPHLYTRIYTKTKVACCIAFTWIFSYVVLIPTMMGKWGTFGPDEKLGTCSINKDENGNTPKAVFFVMGFALPCIVIVICYAKIFWVVRKSHERLQKHTSGTDYKRSEMKVTKMVLVIFLCFVTCYLPITIVKTFDPDVNYAKLHAIVYILLYVSPCVNPVIYVTMNKLYRRAYLDTLCCRYTPDSLPNTQSPPSKSYMAVTYMKNSCNPRT